MHVRFGTDGIRGVANRDLTVETVTALGRAAARVLGSSQPYVVGRDTRRSGPMLEAALVAGLCAEGADVRLAGVAPTPAVARLAQADGAAGAVISASHNPFPDNGVKLFAPGGRKLPDDLQARVEAELADLAGAGPSPGPVGTGVGVAAELRDALDRYVELLAAPLEGRSLRGLSVVVDVAHGAAFRVAPRALRELGARVQVLNATPNGVNINDGCGSTDPAGLRDAVREAQADAGLAFDGDADRVIAVDERGALVDGDQIVAAMALDMNRQGRLRNRAVAITVMSNLGLRSFLTERGIGIVETAVGDRNVLDALERNDLALGGEQSGHVVFPDLAPTGDGLLTGVLLLDAMIRSGRKLSRLTSGMIRWPQVLHSVPVADPADLQSDERFATLVDRVAAELGADGRVLVRSSGTEAVVRVMVEASSSELAESLAQRLVGAARELGGPAEPPR